ncbi:hypothetical protein M433DRAFT_160580, partial [Acidomyces richmondensis BFW]
MSPTAASRSYTGFEVPYQDNRELVRALQEDYPTLYALADAIKERFSQFDKEQYLGTIEALTQYVEEVLRRGPVDIIQYSRAFDRIVRRAQE